MRNDPPFITISAYLHQTLMDWKSIIQYLKRTPRSVLQLVTDYSTYMGYYDACKYGMGGTWLAGTKSLEPTVWQVPIPENIQNRLCTHTNKKGDITMNDLDLAAEVLSFLVLEHITQSLKFAHVNFLWRHVSCVMGIKTTHQQVYSSSTSPPHIGIRIHHTQAPSLTPISIAGEENKMVDVSSRAFKHRKLFMANSSLTFFFNAIFLLPQSISWRISNRREDLTH